MCTTWIAGEIEGKTVVFTNKHCVRKVFDCTEELAFRFPGTKEFAECSRMLKISEFEIENANGTPASVPDYAIILLDRKLIAKPIPISQKGLKPYAKITIRKAWKVGDRSIEMQQDSCEVGAPNMLNPNFTGEISPNTNLFGCKLKHGVSGSPVIDDQGRAAGIVQIGSNDNQGTTLPTLSGLDSTEFDINNYGVASNLACVNFPSIGLNAAPQGCSIETTQSAKQDNLKKLLEPGQMIKGFLPEYEKFIENDAFSLFGWEIRPDDGQLTGLRTGGQGLLAFELVPKCISRLEEPYNHLTSDYYKKSSLGSWFGTWESEGYLEANSPAWKATAKADKYGVLHMVYTAYSKPADYRFSPHDLATLKEGETATVIEEVYVRSTSMSLPLCKPGQLSSDRAGLRKIIELSSKGDDPALEAAFK